MKNTLSTINFKTYLHEVRKTTHRTHWSNIAPTKGEAYKIAVKLCGCWSWIHPGYISFTGNIYDIIDALNKIG